MMYFITVLVFVFVFSLLILIHELGHFYMARRAGIKVEEFGFGLPPRIWGKKVGDTLYSINAIPFGGFVRMFGEDSKDPKALKSKDSFASKTMKQRAGVLVAGVFMNFVLAWFLLTVGFIFGIEPLLTPDEVLPAVNQGVIKLKEGAKVETVLEGSLAEEVGFESGDFVFSKDGKILSEESFAQISKNPAGFYVVDRGGDILNLEVTSDMVTQNPDQGLGVELADMGPVPRVRIFSLDEGSPYAVYGLRAGDVILRIDGNEVFYWEQYDNLVRGKNVLTYEVYREGKVEQVVVELEGAAGIVVSRVLEGSPAEEAGLMDGDVVLAFNGIPVEQGPELVEAIAAAAGQEAKVLVERSEGQRVLLNVNVDESGKLGIYMSDLVNRGSNDGIALYGIDVLSSIESIEKQRYPVYIAPYEALKESVRLGKLTVVMFGDFLGNLVKSGEVPDSVAGPVGIAQLTYGFVQEGFMSVLRFVAILSLSLAVLNILPLPALDGGRLLFVLVEFIIGRPVDQRYEAVIHGVGYILLLGLIVLVTYNDVMRLFN